MKFRKSLLMCLALMLLTAMLGAPALAKVVSPGEDFFYLDNANVLSEELEGEIYFANKLLTEACGAQIVVVTLDTTGRQAIDVYAYNLLNEWGVGDASRNNGFVLLLAIDDDDYYASTGAGLTGKFPADVIKDFYDAYLEDDFAAKNYEAGVKKFFEATFERIAFTYNADVTIDDAIAAYKAYAAKNSATNDFGGYTGSRRSSAVNDDYRRDEDSGIGLGFVLVVLLIIVLVVVMSKGRRARRRTGVMPPPPPPPRGIGGVGYRPTRTVYHRGPTFGGGFSDSLFGGGSSRSSFVGGSSRSSFGGGSSRSSFGGGSSHSSFGGSSRSSGFGGGSGGGGRSAGGGAGRGRR